MKKLVVSFASALFAKMVVIPVFTQTPVGPVNSLNGWLYDLNVLSIVVLGITIPIITYKFLKNK